MMKNAMRTANHGAPEDQSPILGISVSQNALMAARDMPSDGWFVIAPFGEHPAPDRSYVQIFDRNQADETVKTWNSVPARAFRWIKNVRHRLEPRFSVPIVEVGHIDTDPRDYSKLPTLGELLDVRATSNALEGFVKWNPDALAKRAAGPLYPSILWWHDRPNAEGKVFPVHIESVALVRDPNISGVPAWTKNASPEAAAEKTKNDNNEMKEKLLKLLGLGADATDDQITSGVEALQKTANSADEKLTTANSAKEKAEGDLKTANAAKEKAEADLKTANSEKEKLTTANGALVDGILTTFEKAGKITPAQKQDWKTKFTANDAKIGELVNELAGKKAEMNTTHIEIDGTRLDISTANARAEAVQTAVSKVMIDQKIDDYNVAYAKVRGDKKYAALFDAMSDPLKKAAA